MEVNDVPAPLSVAAAGPLQVELRLGNGRCHAKGCAGGELNICATRSGGATIQILFLFFHFRGRSVQFLLQPL